MGDVDDAELLAPIAYPRTSRAAYPFKRREQSNVLNTTGGEGAVGETLKIVYDRHFDRFFLRADSAPSEPAAPAKSPKPRRAGAKPAPAKKRSLTAGVQWEDLVVPPRSVIKRHEVDISYEYQGLSEDSTTAAVKQRLEAAAIVRQQAEPALDGKIGPGEISGKPQDIPLAETLAPMQTTSTDKLVQGKASLDHRVSDIWGSLSGSKHEPQAPGAHVPQSEPVQEHVPVPSSEAPSAVSVGVGDSKTSDQVLASPSTVEQHSADEKAPLTEQTLNDDSSATPPVSEAATSTTGPTSKENEDATRKMPPATFLSIVRVRRLLYRRIRKRQAATSQSVTLTDNGSVADAVLACDAVAQAKDVEGHVPSESTGGTTGAVESAKEPEAVASTPLSPITAEDNQARVPVVERAPTTQNDKTSSISALHLDLSKLSTLVSSQTKPKSPLRKSPKRKARMSSYARRLEATTANDSSVAADAPPSTVLAVDNQHEHQIRWQGEVIHVRFKVPVDDDSVNTASCGYAVPRQAPQQTLSHLYSLRELARIRPRADGFRRVNEACTFTPLTSSSESSESDGEPSIAVVDVPSSSDDDFDDSIVFRRGDKVLFHARHRWFKGVILKRIKQSWFYDIRAANGTVFEAIQAKRIRLFDGEDDEPKYSFEVGDRVLWRPSDAENSREHHQNYKARVLAIRKYGSSSSRSSRDEPKKRYDLELLTGRVVKKVPHDELSPLRKYR